MTLGSLVDPRDSKMNYCWTKTAYIETLGGAACLR
jgi:hypothetical protein